MKQWMKAGGVLILFFAMVGCGAIADEVVDAVHTAATISRNVPKKISFRIPANMLNAVSGSITPASVGGTNTVGPAYAFLKEYATLVNNAGELVDAVISNVNANTNYLFQTNVIGNAFTNQDGTEWYYFNTNATANYVYIGDVSSNGINTNFYMDWSGADNAFIGKAIFYANDPTADMQEGTLIFDYSVANPTLDVYIKFKAYFTNFRVLLTSLGDGKLSIQARILGNHPTNTITDDSWVNTWEIVGYGQTNAPGGARAWISGTYTNMHEFVQTNIVTTNTSYFNGLEITTAYTNIQTASVYDYEEYFSTGGTTEWKMGSAQMGGTSHYSIDFRTNVLSTPVQWNGTWDGTNYATNIDIPLNFTVTNYDDTYPVIVVGADIVTTTGMDGSTNVSTNTVYYENTNTKPYSDVTAQLTNLGRLSDANYPNNTLYSM